jgi:outer membrane lipoprotein-sorting protein
MEQFTSQTGENDVKDGKLVYVPEKGRDPAFRIEWTKPAEQLSIRNGRYKMYRVNLKVAYIGSVDGVGKGKETNSVLVFLNLSKAQLKAAFDINYLGQENVSGGTATWHLQLIPKSGTSYKNADIWVNKDGMLLQMRQTEKNGDTTTVLLSHLSENTQVDMSKIEVVIPKGVEVKRT